MRIRSGPLTIEPDESCAFGGDLGEATRIESSIQMGSVGVGVSPS